MSTTVTEENEIIDPWASKGDGGGAIPPTAPPPPPHGGFPDDPDGLMEPSFMHEKPHAEAVAARGEVMSQWADDLPHEALHAEHAITDLTNRTNVDSDDKGDGLVKVEVEAEKK